jgi:cell fate (sporulation/competence/biofilm development) regulator YlbF (YheA/YmcA/DUF963 family)
MDVLEMAKQLGEAISVSEQFVRFAEAEEKFKTDETAQALLLKYNTERGELAAQMQKEDIKPMEMIEIRKKLAKQYSDLLKNDIIKEYTEAKAGAEKLLSDVNAIIQFCVTGEDADGEHSSCTGSCSTCSGCH